MYQNIVYSDQCPISNLHLQIFILISDVEYMYYMYKMLAFTGQCNRLT